MCTHRVRDNPARITRPLYAGSVLLVVALLAAAAPDVGATAPLTPAQRLARGETALDSLDYEIAAEQAMLAAIDARATDAEKVRANLLAGIAHRILGRDLEARINFRYVLLRAPETRLDAASPPKVALFFESVRQEMEAERAAQRPEPAHLDGKLAPASPAAPSDEGAGPVVVAGAVVAGAGALALLGGAGGLTFAETALADPTRPGAERSSLRVVGQVSAVGAAAGALLAIAGGLVVGVAAGSP